MLDNIIVVTGPSAVGKTTLTQNLLKLYDNLEQIPSVTTRSRRENEKDPYLFTSKHQFNVWIAQDKFIEYSEHYNNYYGTLKREVEKVLYSSHKGIKPINVDGAIQMKKLYGKKVLSVFLKPDNPEKLFDRVKERGTESDISRIKEYEREMTFAGWFDLQVTAVDPYQTLQEVVSYLDYRKFGSRSDIRDKAFYL